jgi:eukaryotic-like serine/threonine-protein kinase
MGCAGSRRQGELPSGSRWPPREKTAHGFPQYLPNGSSFLFFIESPDPNKEGVYAASLDRPHERVRILATIRKAIYAPPVAGGPGHLVWLREQTLVAQRFDAARLRLEGDPTPVAQSVLAPLVRARAAFWTSDAGLLVYRAGEAGLRQMTWYSRDGKRLGEVGPEKEYRDLCISPDGSRVAVSILDQGKTDLWLFDFGRKLMTRLTFDSGNNEYPVWSPDGRQIAFVSDRSGSQIYRKDASGAGAGEQLTREPGQKVVTDWSRDGRTLLYVIGGSATSDLWALPLEGDRKPVHVLQSRGPFGDGKFSPDGKWVAYQSNESGEYEIYVQGFPSSGSRWQVSGRGGSRAKWSRDGTELFFIPPAGTPAILAARIRTTGTRIESDSPSELVTGRAPFPSVYSPYDVAPDGRRLLLLEASVSIASALTVVENWQAGLQK